MHEITGAEVYLKCRYTGQRNEPYVYKYGKNFEIADEEVPQIPEAVVDPTIVRQAAAEGVREAVAELTANKASDLDVSLKILHHKILFLISETIIRLYGGNILQCNNSIIILLILGRIPSILQLFRLHLV